MFTNFHDVVQATLDKYQDATRTCRAVRKGPSTYGMSVGTASYCVYSHEPNGLGCAVGCHMDERDCLVLDQYHMGIDSLLAKHPDVVVPILTKYFDKDLLGKLQRLQDWHDRANTAEELRLTLRLWLGSTEGRAVMVDWPATRWPAAWVTALPETEEVPHG